MHKSINSSELAKQVSEKLQLSQADGLGLYKELSQISDGFVKDALSALLEKAETNQDMLAKHTSCLEKIQSDLDVFAGQGSEMSRYVACISSGYVRDAQYATKSGADCLDDDDRFDDDAWVDADLPLYLKIVEADTRTRAAQIAASHAGVDEDVIELIPIK